jgi:hypothetical protein
MPGRVASPTPHHDVNAILHDLLTRTSAILVDRFVGLYVEGSLALGDFDTESSDIDFVVVTDDDVRGEQLVALQEMHARIARGNSRWATELEGSYIPRHALRRYDRMSQPYPRIERGAGEALAVRPHDIDWVIHLHVLREHGFALAGPPARTLVDPVTADELRRAVVGLMRVWWAPMVADPGRLQHDGYRTYAVLTMCRMLYTLQHGRVVSKSFAARWAACGPARRWTALIKRAMADPQGAHPDDLRESLELIQFTARRCETLAHPARIASHTR